jgi:hypothetical protein
VVHVSARLSRWLQCDEGIRVRLGATFSALLRELTLSGQVLASLGGIAQGTASTGSPRRATLLIEITNAISYEEHPKAQCSG